GGEQRARAVHVDAPALEHDLAPALANGPQGEAQRARRALRHAVVLAPVRVLGPAVEAEARDGHRARAVLDEDGPEVARPAAVEGKAEELDKGGIDGDARQEPARAGLRPRARHEDPHDLPRREVAHDLAVDPGDRRELAGPVREAVRPREPGGLVPL